jgi:putative heme iron utilization protein
MITRIVLYVGNPANARTLKKWSYLALVLVFVSDFFVHREHAMYIWDKIPGWGAVYGFVSCVVIILVSKFLGHQGGIMQREDYYND